MFCAPAIDPVASEDNAETATKRHFNVLQEYRIDAWGTLNVIFMAALKPQHFMFEATSGHQNVISA